MQLENQAPLLISTLGTILKRLVNSSPQLVSFFMESYLRELNIRILDEGATKVLENMNRAISKVLEEINGDFGISD